MELIELRERWIPRLRALPFRPRVREIASFFFSFFTPLHRPFFLSSLS
jgi:hypothetical protein